MEAVGPLQIRIMHHLWTHGPNTVQAVHTVLNAENNGAGLKSMAYTTVLTVMRNLVRRKILLQVKGSRAHRFVPLIDRCDYQLGILRQARHDLFQGDMRALLACLATDEDMAPDLRHGLLTLVGTPARH